MLTLHVTNGDHAAQGLARSGLHGDVLAWRDVLHEGPVPADSDPDRFRRVRAEFLSERHGATTDEVEEDLRSRDARLREITCDHAIVLWFEPDLYDQLQLIQVLAALEARDPASRPHLSIAPADLMLGPLKPEGFLPLYERRRAITDEDLANGAAAWSAFTAADPESLMGVVDRFDRTLGARTYAADETVRLPHLTAALRRMLEEYPDVDTGLSRSERQIVEALTAGPMALSKLYPAAHHTSESWAWLGDSTFAWYVQRLSDGARPLVSHPNGTRVIAPRGNTELRSFWERSVTLTPFGADVVRARGNAIEANGIDRWIGGVHLTAARHWRWDGRVQRLVSMA
jgi:hypothetical protein